MTARIIQFPVRSATADAVDVRGDTSQSPAELQAEIDRLERLDHDLQVQAHRTNLALGEVRRKRLGLLKRIARMRSA